MATAAGLRRCRIRHGLRLCLSGVAGGCGQSDVTPDRDLRSARADPGEAGPDGHEPKYAGGEGTVSAKGKGKASPRSRKGAGKGATPSEAFAPEGRICVDLFRQTLPFDAYDFYMCGPPPFMQGLYDQLSDVGVPDARIHAEAFGPGEAAVIPAGFRGVFEVVEAVEKYYVIVTRPV